MTVSFLFREVDGETKLFVKTVGKVSKNLLRRGTKLNNLVAD